MKINRKGSKKRYQISIQVSQTKRVGEENVWTEIGDLEETSGS